MTRLRIIAFFLILGSALAEDTWNTWMNEGVRALESGRYREACVAFQKSVDLNPSAVEARLYLATSYMSQYIPGATTPENLQAAGNAEREFLAMLEVAPKNLTALESMASLKHYESQGTQSETDKLKLLDETRGWYLRVLEADPTRMQAHYSLGVVAWATWYSAWNVARAKLGMRPDEPGPLQDAAVRADLRARYDRTLQDGIDHLNQALALDPKYDDAMAYMNLLVRESADLADSHEEYQKMTLEADAWVQKALEARHEKFAQGGLTASNAATSAQAGGGSNAAPPPQPAGQRGSTPRRIYISANVSSSMLTRQVAPIYPPIAKEARVQGTVRLTAILAKDGSVLQLDVESGHPLLVPAALEAVGQWRYQPTLLNGDPLEVVTPVDVNFVLDKSN